MNRLLLKQVARQRSQRRIQRYPTMLCCVDQLLWHSTKQERPMAVDVSHGLSMDHSDADCLDVTEEQRRLVGRSWLEPRPQRGNVGVLADGL